MSPRGASVVAAGLLAAGLHALLAGLVPWLGVLRPLTDERPGSAYAGYSGAGLLLVATAAALLALVPDGRPRRTALLVAAGLPILVAAGVLLLSAPQVLSPGEPTPEIARLLALAAPAAAMLAPATLFVVQAGERPAGAVRLTSAALPWLLLAVLTAFGATVGLAMAQRVPFAWDESVYGLLARTWVEGTPSSGWGVHRPVGLSVLGVLPVLAGGEDWQLRVVGLAFGIGLVAATWYAARSMGAAPAGLLAAAVVAGSSAIAYDSGLYFNDIPSAAMGVLGVAVLWRTMERPGPVGWGILWLAPIAAAAFYLRYGAAVPVAGMALAALLTWPTRIVASWPRVVATLGLLAVLLLPHLAFSVAETGSPLGIMAAGQAAAGPASFADGLLEYLDAFPAPLAGLLPAAFMVLGIAGFAHALASALRRRSTDPRARALSLLVLTALFQVVVLGLTIHAEPRYVYLAVSLLVIAGSLVLTDAARRRGRLGRALLALAAACAVVSMVVNLVGVPQLARERAEKFGWERELGLRIDSVAPDGDCVVVVATVPQTSWYSRCATVPFANSAPVVPEADARFLVVREDSVGQPDESTMQAYLRRVIPEPAAVVRDGDGTERARVYRFAE